MTNEELSSCIRAGERDLIPALWEQVEKFVRLQADRQCRAHGGEYHGLTPDDLYQSGYIALVAAVDHYEDGHDTKFITFFAHYLRAVFQQQAGIHRSAHPDPLLSCKSLDAPAPGLSEDDGVTLGDTIQDPSDAYEGSNRHIYTVQLHAALETAMSDLTPEQADILRARYFDGLTGKELAERHGVDVAKVYTQERSSIRKIRRSKHSAKLESFLDERTNFYYSVGVDQFTSTHTSAVEEIVFRRDRMVHGA